MAPGKNTQNATTQRLGIAGLGVVGGEVARQILGRDAALGASTGHDFSISAVSARNRKTDRGFAMKGIDWVGDAVDLAGRDDVDVVVELIGGEDGIALELARRTLSSGKHFVTANKAMIAHHGAELAGLAERNGAGLMFEAAVAGGVPVIKALREGLAGNRVTRVSGILNGTCNYVLTRMAGTGEAFADVLADAQKLGYAEAEPSLDVDGIDAAHKLAILAAIAFARTPDFGQLHISGIRDVSATDFDYANRLGFRIKLVGVAEPGRVPRMQTCLLPQDMQLAKVDGVLNAVAIEADPLGGTILIGPGAGAGATASAVLSDLADIACGRIPHAFGRPVAMLGDAKGLENGGGPDTAYYVRLNVVDRPGVLADVTSVLQKHDISVESLLQQGRAPQDAVALVMATHEVAQTKLAKALERIERLDCVRGAPVHMPILTASAMRL